MNDGPRFSLLGRSEQPRNSHVFGASVRTESTTADSICSASLVSRHGSKLSAFDFNSSIGKAVSITIPMDRVIEARDSDSSLNDRTSNILEEKTIANKPNDDITCLKSKSSAVVTKHPLSSMLNNTQGANHRNQACRQESASSSGSDISRSAKLYMRKELEIRQSEEESLESDEAQNPFKSSPSPDTKHSEETKDD